MSLASRNDRTGSFRTAARGARSRKSGRKPRRRRLPGPAHVHASGTKTSERQHRGRGRERRRAPGRHHSVSRPGGPPGSGGREHAVCDLAAATRRSEAPGEHPRGAPTPLTSTGAAATVGAAPAPPREPSRTRADRRGRSQPARGLGSAKAAGRPNATASRAHRPRTRAARKPPSGSIEAVAASGDEPPGPTTPSPARTRPRGGAKARNPDRVHGRSTRPIRCPARPPTPAPPRPWPQAKTSPWRFSCDRHPRDHRQGRSFAKPRGVGPGESRPSHTGRAPSRTRGGSTTQ